MLQKELHDPDLLHAPQFTGIQELQGLIPVSQAGSQD